MSTICEIGLIQEDNSIDIIFCTWDGNLIGTGKVLAERFNGYLRAKSLIDKKYTIKSIDEQRVSKDNLQHHFEDLADYKKHIEKVKDANNDGDGIGYFYLFDQHKWLVSCVNNGYQFQSLKKVLSDPNADDPDAKLVAGDMSMLMKPINIVEAVKSTSKSEFAQFKQGCIESEGDSVKGIKEFAAICFMVNKSVASVEQFYEKRGKRIHLAEVDKRVYISASKEAITIKFWAASFKIFADNPNGITINYFRPEFNKSIDSPDDIKSSHRDVVEDNRRAGGSEVKLNKVIAFNIDNATDFSSDDDVESYLYTKADKIADWYLEHLQDLKSRGAVFMESKFLTFDEYLFG